MFPSRFPGPVRRPLSMPCLLLALAWGSGVAPAPARAADPTAGHRASKVAAAAGSTAPARAAHALHANSASLPSGKDPLEHLRERLAEKLGGEERKPQSPLAPPTVKLVNRAEPGAEPAAAPRQPRPAPHRSAMAAAPGPATIGAGTDHAARLATLHRQASGVAHGAAGPVPHWSYQGERGPAAWGELQPGYSTCASGRRQSPIDIRDGLALDLDPVRFDYRPSAVRVIDNGHTVQVNVESGNHIEVIGRRYELQQFHFHRPSEERLDGRQFDMVAHLVHKDREGRLAVVAVLLSRGAAQPLIQTVWNNLPLEQGVEHPVRDPLDLVALLPEQRGYATYMGSLTTPPCTEGVLWMVMKTPVQVSAEQIHVFSRLYPMNARPLQSAGGRLIKESH